MNLKTINISSVSFLLLLTCLVHSTSAEVFTALAEMEELLETESYLISNLKEYIQSNQQKLDFLNKKVAEYEREHKEAANDITAYVANPINAYLLTKRLSNDWNQVKSVLKTDPAEKNMKNLDKAEDLLKFPSSEDVTGAATALMRLQDTYKLDTSSIANGVLNGIKYSSELSTGDCFELGKQSYFNNDFYHTIQWMTEALNKLVKEEGHLHKVNGTDNNEFTKAEILEYLAFSSFKEGNVESALKLTHELLELEPDHERARGNVEWYETILQKAQEKAKLGDDNSEDIQLSNLKIEIERTSTYDQLPEYKAYEALCRGDLKLTPYEQRNLKCKYVTNNVPFLKIAPLKLEEAYLSPYIVIYHDVIYEKEMELVKSLAKPRFRRATVQNSKTGKLETANYRISKSSWLKTEEHEYIGNIVQRTEDMTGLDMNAAEELQVVNYGIGGHYEPHFDFSRKDEGDAFKELGTGNRIATVLFYMSDVEQGGATVFPALRVALVPKKGSAAFWYNLHASGEGDFRTRHAACPVLTGSKWVSNKWIHERMQEFRRPCGLTPDHPITE